MSTELPTACTLEGSELAERGAEMAALGADALVDVELDGAHAVLRFEGARQRVEDLVEGERRCCNFLEFAVRANREETTVDVRAPAAAEQVLGEWVRAIAGDRLSTSTARRPSAPRSPGLREIPEA